jgi:hypothetical protein
VGVNDVRRRHRPAGQFHHGAREVNEAFRVVVIGRPFRTVERGAVEVFIPPDEKDLHAIRRGALQDFRGQLFGANGDRDVHTRRAHAELGVLTQPSITRQNHTHVVPPGAQRRGQRLEHVAESARARKRIHFAAGEKYLHECR